MGDLFAALNRAGRTIADSPVSAAALGGLLDLMADDTISGRIAKDVFEAMVQTGDDPVAIIEAKGLRQVTDTAAIDAAVAGVLAASVPGGLAASRFGPHGKLIHPDRNEALVVAALARELPVPLRGLEPETCEADRQLEIGRADGLAAVCADLVERSVA
jgi:hypothetical protein